MKLDRKIDIIKRMQEEMDHRTDVEERAVQLICEGRYGEAVVLLNSLDDSVIAGMQEEFEAIEAGQQAVENAEKILDGMKKEALRSIKETSYQEIRAAWYHSHLGSIDFARQMGLISEERRHQLYEEFKKELGGMAGKEEKIKIGRRLQAYISLLNAREKPDITCCASHQEVEAALRKAIQTADMDGFKLAIERYGDPDVVCVVSGVEAEQEAGQGEAMKKTAMELVLEQVDKNKKAATS